MLGMEKSRMTTRNSLTRAGRAWRDRRLMPWPPPNAEHPPSNLRRAKKRLIASLANSKFESSHSQQTTSQTLIASLTLFLPQFSTSDRGPRRIARHSQTTTRSQVKKGAAHQPSGGLVATFTKAGFELTSCNQKRSQFSSSNKNALFGNGPAVWHKQPAPLAKLGTSLTAARRRRAQGKEPAGCQRYETQPGPDRPRRRGFYFAGGASATAASLVR
jgi:hypothetical protein